MGYVTYFKKGGTGHERGREAGEPEHLHEDEGDAGFSEASRAEL